jgi:hypothetical protein
MTTLTMWKRGLKDSRLGQGLLGGMIGVMIAAIETIGEIVVVEEAVVEVVDADVMGGPKYVLFAPTRSRRLITSSTTCSGGM